MMVQECSLQNNWKSKQFMEEADTYKILGWQQRHYVFFHDFQSKFIDTNNKH